MPKVIGHTPPWLSHPSPGGRIFSDPEAQSPASPSKRHSRKPTDGETSAAACSAAQRTIAYRGSEIFTVVGNKIRWADLARVKDEWEGQGHSRPGHSDKSGHQPEKRAYRTFKTPVYYQITNLTVSPSGHFLAISTEHTVHVAVLPDSSRLHDSDHSEIKLRTHHVGPTTHVIPEAALAAVLWHPLAASSASTDCLVTVSTEAAVRVWEFDHTDRWSVERPALAIDLRRLADGTSSDQDFEPSGFGKSRGFSADTFDMEAAAACFGGRGAEHEDPWAATSLWITMTNGDVYALCPLLPSRWKPTSMTIPALTTSAVAKKASMSPEDVEPDEKRAAEQRYEWVQELDNETLDSDDSTLLRPSILSAIPRLQGPFELPVDETSDDSEISDILVIPANLDEEDLFSGEDDYEILGSAKSLPFSIICLATTTHQLHVMIELEGVTGQWLPKKGKNHFSSPTWKAGEFVLLETISLGEETEVATCPMAINPDPTNPYLFFVTTGSGVWSISLEDWASRVAFEVTDEDSDTIDPGLQSRLKLACQGPICVSKELIPSQQLGSSTQASLSTAVFIEDINLGSLLLASSDGRAIAAQLDQTPFRASQMLTNEPSFSTSAASPFRASQSLMQVLQTEVEPMNHTPPTRAPYAPPQIFYHDQMAALDHVKSRVPPQRRSMLTENPLRLSPACLDVMTLAHRTFSHQTSVVETAAAELFRRCERLRQELGDQVKQMAELAERLNRLGPGSDYQEKVQTSNKSDVPHSEKLNDRIEAAKSRQKELYSRYERLRRKAGQVGHAKQELSIKEKAWVDEVDSLAVHVGIESEAPDQDTSKQGGDTALTSRLTAAKSLIDDLMAEAKRVKDQTNTETENKDDQQNTPDGKLRTSLGGSGNMSRFQRRKIQEVMEMVEREAAVIEAVQGRLSRLSV
ncbi:hypothetical protein PMZ80_000157 [Knufia obscura]|uniref:Uncharacterized protein n=2 Tax=Knufia TaxID=430999 RepID=A0AAN8I847_9EURO|nr:hypothetical protein PMZ80_000157 [Knufia obscura]KAK5956914.1 hypothetical protein OHC33_002403 [Knufia fluminis]